LLFDFRDVFSAGFAFDTVRGEGCQCHCANGWQL
jgi:uncharacterized protein YhdP